MAPTDSNDAHTQPDTDPELGASHLLDIDTIIERPTIRIDGADHEITSPDELTIIQSQKLAMLGRKHDKLMKSDSSEPATENALSNTLEAMMEIILQPMDHAVRAKLRDPHKTAVIEVFTMLLLANKAKLAGVTTGAGGALGGLMALKGMQGLPVVLADLLEMVKAKAKAAPAAASEQGSNGSTPSAGASDITAAAPTSG